MEFIWIQICVEKKSRRSVCLTDKLIKTHWWMLENFCVRKNSPKLICEATEQLTDKQTI
jgi:hypothetical protein